MARNSDIPYHGPESMYEQYLHQASLLADNDCITDAIEKLPVFPLYSFEPDTLYGAVDGQKFCVERPTVKTLHPRKYTGHGKGMLDYTLQWNHIPVNRYLIGTNDYEGHHVFDIWYHNPSVNCLKTQPDTERLTRNLIYSTKPQKREKEIQKTAGYKRNCLSGRGYDRSMHFENQHK